MRIATRASALALAQAELVAEALANAPSQSAGRPEIEIVPMNDFHRLARVRLP